MRQEQPAKAAGAWDREVDLLVAGAGAGGMTAGLVAALEGLDVLLCEKAEQLGGTTATSAGTLWIPGNRQSRDAGFADTAAEAGQYLDSLVGDAATKDLRDAFLATGPDAIDYLMARSDVQFMPCGRHPDYQSNRPGAAVAGRVIMAREFDGRLLGRDFARLRPPIPEFLVLGGMMVGKSDIPPLVHRFASLANFRHAAGLFWRYCRDRLRYPRGTRLVMGNALIARLYHSLRKAGVPVLFGAPIADLVREGDAVVGAVVTQAGKALRIRARRGVVLATGGYGRNAKFRERFMHGPAPERSLAAEPNTGDGMAIAARHRARIASEAHGTGAFWTPVSVTRRKDGTKGLFPHLVYDRAKPGLIAVTKAGRRFTNEASSYHDFVLAMFAANEGAPVSPAWLICEAGFVAKYGLGAIYPGTRDLGPHSASGYLTVAHSIEELARNTGIDADALKTTIDRYNGFAEAGVDLDFGKGDTELNRFNGDPARGPNPCLAPIRTGPFCAMEVWPADLGTSAGLATDIDARVLDANGRSIPGLYACGNDFASIMAGAYPGPGTTLGPAIVFGYRAALHAARAVPLCAE